MAEFKFDRWAESAFFYARNNSDDFRGVRNWVVARNLFGCGRTLAIQYCQHIHIDPDSYNTERTNSSGEMEA